MPEPPPLLQVRIGRAFGSAHFGCELAATHAAFAMGLGGLVATHEACPELARGPWRRSLESILHGADLGRELATALAAESVAVLVDGLRCVLVARSPCASTGCAFSISHWVRC